MNRLLMVKTRAKNTVLYDDGCPMCTFGMRVLTWVDWFGAARLVGLSHPEAKVIGPQLTREQLLEAIHCVTGDGRVYRGARAIRHLGLRMPVLVPLSVLMWVPGVMWIAERIYGVVARNRHVLSKMFGCETVCAVMPAREREDDLKVRSETP